MIEPEKYTIGELSEISGISKQTLRFYDQKGLLSPTNRNKKNNYRIYSENKALQALAIRELQRQGLALTDLKKVSENQNLMDFQQSLEDKIRTLTQELRYIQTQLDYTQNTYKIIQRHLQEIQTKKFKQVYLEELSQQSILSIRYTSKVNAKELFWPRYAELVQVVEEHSLKVTGAFSAIFHGDCLQQFYEEDGDLEVFFPVDSSLNSTSQIQQLPQRRVISMLYEGNYENLLPVYQELIDYAKVNQLTIIGPSIEEYFVNFTMEANPQHWVTKISLPVEKTGCSA